MGKLTITPQEVRNEGKLCSCQCGVKIPYHESACSELCYAKIRTTIQPSKPDTFLRDAIKARFGDMDLYDGPSIAQDHECIEAVLWRCMNQDQRETAIKEIKKL